ncbi:TetR/AcrR family transcriptional regulator [Streptomyces sp. NPDC051366]|uniref:TetR/AcrR family transcriptional regulator n=1 Tax=Streptomyces sp. NPDC051366 TaxID=3365652 RepID=UPI0037AFF78E
MTEFPFSPKAADTRHRIIDAVLRIIGQDGIAQVANRRIAKEARVSLGSVTDLQTALDAVGPAASGAGSTAGTSPLELYDHAGRAERLRAAAAECFAAYGRLAAGIPTSLGLPDAERLASTVVALVFGQQLRRPATGSPAENLVGALLTLTNAAARPPVPASRDAASTASA